MASQKIKEYGVCKLSVASVWKTATPERQLVTQVLFGEMVKIINVKNRLWVRVACVCDNTVGWMHADHLFYMDQTQYSKIGNIDHFNLELIYGLISGTKSIAVPLGARLHNFDGINVKMPFGKFQFSGQAFSLDEKLANIKLMLKMANKFLNAPEMKGGRSVLGIDASSFVQLLFNFAGLQLPRYAEDQSLIGEDIGFVTHAQEGDLAFFTKRDNRICHVGMITGPLSIIHVSGRVKIDKIDQQGLYDLEAGRYTYKLRTIRRLIDIQNHSH